MSPPYAFHLFDLFMLIMVYMGASVWFGRWRTWIDHVGWRKGWPSLPWLALATVYFRLMVIFHSVDPILFAHLQESHPDLLTVPSYILGGIGLSAMSFRFPKWAMPPWYREQQKVKQAEEDSGDESTR